MSRSMWADGRADVSPEQDALLTDVAKAALAELGYEMRTVGGVNCVRRTPPRVAHRALMLGCLAAGVDPPTFDEWADWAATNGWQDLIERTVAS